MELPWGRSNRTTPWNSSTTRFVHSSRTFVSSCASATANVRSMSDQRSPAVWARDPTTAPETTRGSDVAQRSTSETICSRLATLNIHLSGYRYGDSGIVLSFRAAILTDHADDIIIPIPKLRHRGVW